MHNAHLMDTAFSGSFQFMGAHTDLLFWDRSKPGLEFWLCSRKADVLLMDRFFGYLDIRYGWGDGLEDQNNTWTLPWTDK